MAGGSKLRATHRACKLLLGAMGVFVLMPSASIWAISLPEIAATASAPPASTAGDSSPQVTGLWYDPAKPGQGFNLQLVNGGLFGYYYGYDDGKPLWLITDLHSGPVVFGESIVVDTGMPQEGVFGDPVPPDQGGVALWGTLTLRFDSCLRAYARLDGLSGTQEFDLWLLIGLDGFDTADCTVAGEPRPLVDATGAWFDPATPGQGWNFVQTHLGLIGYFYGFDEGGDPLWLFMERFLDIQFGVAQSVDLFRGHGGTFSVPVPPEEMKRWGMVELELTNCRSGIARISGEDGEQEQQLEMLVTVPGLPECTELPDVQWLNDSGIQFCGGSGSGNFESCTEQHPQGQDAHRGRDALAALGELDKIGGGDAGFDFTKISNAGQPLPESAQLGPAAGDWACTRDNVTGLLWEVKVNTATHIRHTGHNYTWFDPDSPDGHSGSAGTTASCNASLGAQTCNTHHYVQAVKAEGLCGTSDWRMPTPHELETIMHYGRSNPAIDTDYFVNTAASQFWSALPRVDSPDTAWAVFFDQGGVDYLGRASARKVRLVSATGDGQ